MEPGSIPAALFGGALIGTAAVIMLAVNGRILGVSGIAAGIVAPGNTDRVLRVLFVAGLIAGGVAVGAVLPQALPGAVTGNHLFLGVAGFAVGFGTRLGGGCTSGHGVCGLSRLSARSMVATAVFMVVAMATVYVSRHVLGGG